jgi:hypothetical protein
LIDLHQTGVVGLRGFKLQEPECRPFSFTIAMWEPVQFLNEIILQGFNDRNLVGRKNKEF